MGANEVINYILEREEIKAAPFAKSIGANPTQIYDLLSGKTKSITDNMADKILSVYPYYNRVWLRTGEGMILKDNSSEAKEAQPIDAPYILYVPLVSQYAHAGYLSGYGDENYMSTLPTIPYIVDHEAQGHYVAFEVKGDSMNDGTEEAILEGDRLLCREIAQDLWAHNPLHYRKWDFVIVHKEGILVKRIINHDVENHTVTIHSLNPLFPDKVIDLADVMQIFNVIELQRPKRR